jgi:hypothetical protein
MDASVSFYLAKCLIPWMKVSVFIINLLVVYRCFNIAQRKLPQFIKSWPGSSGRDDQLMVTLRVQFTWYPWYQTSLIAPECLASKVVECSVLSETIG